MNAENLVTVSAFYKFVALTDTQVTDLMTKVRSYGEVLEILGLILLAQEGINATIAGSPDNIETFKTFLRSIPELADLQFKDSHCQKAPFRRLAIQYREEIVTLNAGIGIPNIKPSNRLSPHEWNKFLRERRDDLTLIDTRNDYEVVVGRFRGAIDPNIKQFNEFPEYVRKSGIAKDKPVLMYCTGGIRCEKAIEEMYNQGYQEVYQLDGGILRYLEECPNSEFDGECFVFDHRVAVDQDLKPTQKYRLCPHCGNPGTEKICCGYCEAEAIVCLNCLEQPTLQSCSKNCAYHLELRVKRAQRNLSLVSVR
jgi:UPF0176 protein